MKTFIFSLPLVVLLAVSCSGWPVKEHLLCIIHNTCQQQGTSQPTLVIGTVPSQPLNVIVPTEDNSNSENTPYSFEYEVKQPEANLNFGHKESADADNNREGVYFVILPDGRKQTVQYVANVNGYQPSISYEQVTAPFGSGKPQTPQLIGIQLGGQNVVCCSNPNISPCQQNGPLTPVTAQLQTTQVFYCCNKPTPGPASTGENIIESSAQVPYSFEYQVNEPKENLIFGHKESADANNNREGVYAVLLPNGQLQTVQYTADSTGYHPTINYKPITVPFGSGKPQPPQFIGVQLGGQNVVCCSNPSQSPCQQNGPLVPITTQSQVYYCCQSTIGVSGNTVEIDEGSIQTPYSFEYEVNQPESNLHFGHKESADANNNREGVYFALLPDGKKQTVQYVANDSGYHPDVTSEQVTAPFGSGKPTGCTTSCVQTPEATTQQVPIPLESSKPTGCSTNCVLTPVATSQQVAIPLEISQSTGCSTNCVLVQS